MTFAEIEDAIRNISENRITKLNVRSWAQVELARLVNRKKYWWRNKALAFRSVAGRATYNLSDVGTQATNAAPDFLQMSSSLYRWDSDTSQVELPFQGDKFAILRMANSIATGDPATFTVEPGKTKVLRLTPIEATDNRLYVGMYYAGLLIKWSSASEDEIPLIPPEFHYVAMLSMQRRAFFYLYGQKDPRFVAAVQDEAQGIKDLDEYRAPSTLHAVEFRSSDPTAFVQSTG